MPCARHIRQEIEIRTGAVRLTDADYANEIITSGDADLAVIGWEPLREGLAPESRTAPGAGPAWPVPYDG